MECDERPRIAGPQEIARPRLELGTPRFPGIHARGCWLEPAAWLLAATSAHSRMTTSASETPFSRTRDFQVENATACPSAPRVRRAAVPRRLRPAMRVSCAAAR